MREGEIMVVIIIAVLIVGEILFFSMADHRVSENNTYTFQAYKNRYPDLVKDSSVKCIKCEGSSTRMKEVGGTPFGAEYVHVCRNSGHRLYYSRC